MRKFSTIGCSFLLLLWSTLGQGAGPKVFEAGRLTEIASELRAQIGTSAKQTGTLAAGLQQVAALRAAGKNAEAFTFLGGVIAGNSTSSSAWAALADLTTDDFQADLKNQRQAELIGMKVHLGAEYNAFLYADGRVEEAAALKRLAADLFAAAQASVDFYAMDGKSRYSDNPEVAQTALAAIRRSAALDPRPDTKELLASISKKYGMALRERDYGGDNNTFAEIVDPRVCYDFTQTLEPRAADPDRYVSVEPRRFSATTGGKAAISVKDHTLCIDGLLRKVDYHITFKAGLPGVAGAALAEDATANVNLPARNPSVRFVGRTYVVPRQGPDTIPLLSNGLSEVELAVYRIGDRGIGPLLGNYCVHSGAYAEDCLHFPHPPAAHEYTSSSNDLASIIASSGQKIWPTRRRGYVAVKPNADPEKDTRTSLALDSVIPERKPGVYLVIARSPLESNSSFSNGDSDSTSTEPHPDEADWSNPAAQWLVITDIGLSTLEGPDGLTVLARSLASAASLPDIELRLVARNNEILASSRTGADGIARFGADLLKGTRGNEPVAVVALAGNGDYSVLNLLQPAFDLTDRGIDGRNAPEISDPFIATERGVYRQGETVSTLVLLRTVAGDALADTPVRIKVIRPDGGELGAVPSSSEDQGAGGRVFKIPLPRDAPRGTWRIECYLDPTLPAIGSKEFLVDDYVAEKLDFDLKPESDLAAASQLLAATIEGRYLYGGPAADLAIEGRVKIEVADKVKGAPPGFVFGLGDEEFQPVVHTIDGLPSTDSAGRARIAFPFPPTPATSRPLQAEVTIGLREEGGRAVKRGFVVPIRPSGPMIGIKPHFAQGMAEQNSDVVFDVIVLDPNGQPQAAPDLRWTLQEIRQDFQWYRDSEGDRLSYRPFTRMRAASSGTVRVTRNGPAALRASVGSGRYRLDLALDGKTSATTSYSFDAGWFVGKPEENPETIEVTLGKPTYAVGETAQINLYPRFSGRAVVAIYSDHLIAQKELDLVKDRQATLGLEVSREWGPGAYALAFAYRPVDNAETRLRARAIGAVWVGVDPASRRLAPVIEAPAEMRPSTTVQIKLRVPDLGPGEKAYAAVSAVDVGLLNLTRHPAPDPIGWLFSQRQLAAELRDLYAYLVDGTSGDLARAQQGGDVQVLPDEARPPTEIPLSILTPVTPIGPDGTAVFSLTVPQFQGTVRLSAVVWSSTRMGTQSIEQIIRDPVVLTAALPRFLSYGDVAIPSVDVYNAELPAGPMTIDMTFAGPIGVPVAATHRSLQLQEKERTSFRFPVAALGAGNAALTFRISAAGRVITRSFAFPINPAHPDTVSAETARLAPGQSLTLPRDALAGFVPGTGSLSVASSLLLAIDPAELEKAVPRTVGGSTEMMVSRATALWMEMQQSAHFHRVLSQDKLDELHDLLNRICERQSVDGSFNDWPGETTDDDSSDLAFLDIYVTDFMLRAAEAGVRFDERFLDRGLRFLWEKSKKAAGKSGDSTSPTDNNSNGPSPYALYVLARSRTYLAGHPGMRAANYWQGAQSILRDFDDKSVTGALGIAQIAAAAALGDDRDRAHRMFALAVKTVTGKPADASDDSSSDDDSLLAVSAGVLALAGAHGDGATMRSLVPQLARERAKRTDLSGEEVAWLAVAADVLSSTDSAISLLVNGNQVNGPFQKVFTAAELASSVAIKNTSKSPVVLSLTKRGQSTRPLQAPSGDLKLTRRLLRPDGTPADPRSIRQHDRLVILLEANAGDVRDTYRVTAPVPAGFEIESRPLARASDVAEFPFLHDTVKPDWAETSDTSFTALVQLAEKAPTTFSIGYVVRAVTAGKFTIPEAIVTNIHDPEQPGMAPAFEVEIAPVAP
jgi:uncharacterized protein YfaS (alpha-2-macroglobulin family)